MKTKILMVDDEPEFADMIRMRLEANGYEVILAHNGEDGLRRAKEDKPALILLDMMMPVMDGFEVLRRLRQDPALRNLPVVMLTARGESKSIFKAQNMGVMDYLIKPCDSKDLLDVIRRYA